MKIPMNSRLLACCSLVRAGDRVVDVGADHGYLGIYLLKNGIASQVTATDIGEKPLEKAKRNGQRFGVSEGMRFCCTPGLRGVSRKFDTLVCAGLGADTIITILREAPWLRSGDYRLILQCQSSANELRRYLWQQGWLIRRELPVRDGKFLYTVMETVWGDPVPLTPGQEYVSPALLETKSELLREYFARCIAGVRGAVSGIGQSKDPSDRVRLPYYERALQELLEMEEELCRQ